jgi:two-component system chemotaxis response regulator CheY
MTVDDSASMRQVGGVVARRGAGCEVIEAADGKDALSKPKDREAHLFLTGIDMAGIDGLELARRLRAMPEHEFVPIVPPATESHPEKKAGGKAAGATAWIATPFNPDQLLADGKKVVR